jgi:solute carrier family 25 phosphate transporter 3
MAPFNPKDYDSGYYTKAALAGGICCSVTHAAVCPVDVVKTRIQLEPEKYNAGMVAGFRKVIAEEGAMALSTGIGATAIGYFIQGWFKFGGVEVFKIQAVKAMGEEKAFENRTAIYLGSAAGAEFIADCFLCPLEAARIRAVSNPEYGNGLVGVAGRLLREEGVLKGFYSGFGPILFKQIPYTMAKFAVQGLVAEKMYAGMGSSPEKCGTALNTGVSLGSGTIAGVVAAIISHPADTLLSKMNKAGAGGTGSIPSRMMNVTKEMGVVNLCMTGLGARCVMIGTLTALQFGIFDTVLRTLGASKFHFHDPKKH